MTYEPGTILLVEYPFTDQTAAKQRPVLVVSAGRFNHGADLVVVPISSRIIAEDQFGFQIRTTDACFAQTRLRGDSTIKWTKPLTIMADSVVRKQLGKVPPDVLAEVQRLIRSIFS